MRPRGAAMYSARLAARPQVAPCSLHCKELALLLLQRMLAYRVRRGAPHAPTEANRTRPRLQPQPLNTVEKTVPLGTSLQQYRHLRLTGAAFTDRPDSFGCLELNAHRIDRQPYRIRQALANRSSKILQL